MNGPVAAAPTAAESPCLLASLRRVARGATPLGWCALAAGCAVALWAALSVRPVAASAVYGVALVVMIAAAAIDAAEQRLPNVLTLGTATLGFAALPAITWMTGGGSAGRAIAGAVVFGGWILAGALALRGSYGLGDVKLAAACGIYAAWLSWSTLVVAIFSTQVAITATLIYGRLRGRERMPLGPAVAGLLAAVALA